MHLQYDQKSLEIKNAQALKVALEEALSSRSDEFAAFWLHQDKVPVLCLLVNRDDAALCHEPTAMWAEGKIEQSHAPHATMPFRLENGQIDEIPLECVIPVATAIKAFIHFAATRRLTDTLTWR